MTAFCSPLEGVFDGRRRAACNEINNRDFAKNLKRAIIIPFSTWDNLQRVVLPIGGGVMGKKSSR